MYLKIIISERSQILLTILMSSTCDFSVFHERSSWFSGNKRNSAVLCLVFRKCHLHTGSRASDNLERE